ncbi:hydrogenase 4 subunit B [Geothermobacter hydrogeniphilus]|uniref:Hydrogenase 4 subunit B n=1 Tax=Geothermobacter hydrogeniphilus TaxID=1969733 RepID=A0A2K2H9L3_9BACT|nr:hydrogenase 4 subunit B [Geothermobacter hydrogeniphilus]PNU19996.1 hydrogenase 4 subunit B [Geothermobacter hydrogeniphilus]
MPLSLAFTAVGAALLSGLLPLVRPGSNAAARLIAFPLLGISGIFGMIAGGMALGNTQSDSIVLPVGLPWLHSHLQLDPLAGFFLAVVSLVTLVAAIYGPAYVREYEQGPQPLLPLTLFTGLFVAGMQLVLLAADAFSFMIAWELMSVTSYFLVAYQHQHEVNRRAAFIYLLMAQVGGLFILLGYGVLSGFGHGFDFAHMAAATLSPGWSSVAFLLAFVGFGMKAGVVPLHVWLPQAHPVAPSHISALMSGVMLKVAVYGFIRFSYDLLGGIHWQWGALVLFVGSASAILGVLYALMQHDLKRLLAYHSVENIGIIYMGLGLSMIFAGTGHQALAALGLIAALYHCLNHALFKSLLFFGAGVVLQQSHEHDLEKMGGLIRRLPVTATCFLVGCISISALPPFNGFVSEWLTFQTALQGPVLENNILGALIPVAAAVLALTGALAAACFVKVFGICFLGLPRSEKSAAATETTPGPLAGQIVLAVLCLLFGVLPTWTVGQLEHIARLFFPGGMPETTAHGWLWLTPVSSQVASYGAPLVLLGIGLAWVLAWLWMHPRRRRFPVRRAPAWDCGFGPLNARMQYTATAFTMPIRRIFRPVWPITESYRAPTAEEQGGRYQLKIGDWAWLKVYEPIGRLLLTTARRMAMIQGGNIRAYLAYSFFTLIVLLLVVSL